MRTRREVRLTGKKGKGYSFEENKTKGRMNGKKVWSGL